MMLQTIRLGVVAIAAVMQFVIGFVWYSPLLFGTIWAKIEKVKMPKGSKLWQKLAVDFASICVQTYALAYIIDRFAAFDYICAIKISSLLAIAFVGVVHLGAVVWQNKPVQLFLIHVGYAVVALSSAACFFAYMH